MQGADENAKQKSLAGIFNLSENSISELLEISRLDPQIQEEALKSSRWSASKLLQLAKIKDRDKRLKKFKEFSAVINKTAKSQDKVSDSSQTGSEAAAAASDSSKSDEANPSLALFQPVSKNILINFG